MSVAAKNTVNLGINAFANFFMKNEIKNEIKGKEIRNPPLTPKRIPNPEVNPENTGIPIAPRKRYMIDTIAESRGERIDEMMKRQRS